MLVKLLRWLARRRVEPVYAPERRIKLPEEYGEEWLLSLEMHYGDEPLYYVDPPEWP